MKTWVQICKVFPFFSGKWTWKCQSSHHVFLCFFCHQRPYVLRLLICFFFTIFFWDKWTTLPGFATRFHFGSDKHFLLHVATHDTSQMHTCLNWGVCKLRWTYQKQTACIRSPFYSQRSGRGCLEPRIEIHLKVRYLQVTNLSPIW